jgi:molecular chaperone GrpE
MIKKKTEENDNEKAKENGQTSVNNENRQSLNEPGEYPEEIPSEVEIDGLVPEEEKVPETESDKLLGVAKDFEVKLAEMQDKYLRLSAEFDNYRKRTLKEKMDISRYAGEELLKNLLPIADDFERALRHADTSDDCKSMMEGIKLIYTKFVSFLTKNGIREIESLNTSFNVDLHDAVSKVPVTDENQKGKVVEVLLKGYYIKDKVLRHSKVVIGE